MSRIQKRVDGKRGEQHPGGMRLETAEAKVERIIPGELARPGLGGSERATAASQDWMAREGGRAPGD